MEIFMTTKTLVLSGVLSAILCIVSPISINIGIIPVTLSLFIIFLISSLTDTKTAMLSVGVYILLGLFGLPVFSGFTGGIQKLFSPTGGFILSYLPISFLVSYTVKKFGKKTSVLFAVFSIATVIAYLFGSVWFSLLTNTGATESVMITVLPFILPDILKIIVSSIIIPKIKTV